MTPEQYRQQQADLATRTESVVLSVAATSSLSGYTAADQLAEYLTGMNLAATKLADAYVASVLQVRPLGLTLPRTERDRLTAVIISVFEDLRNSRVDPLPRLARIARTEPSNAGRHATSEALTQHDVPGVRMEWVLDPDPCPLCIDLASRTYPVDEVPESHPHCECTVVPTAPAPKKTLRKRKAA